MQFLNQGNIFTNENCVGCNRCVAECPCPGANVAVFDDGVGRIEVNSNKCIECGRCLDVCTHNARSYRDDTSRFFESLQEGKQISLIVSPTFFITYGAKASKLLVLLRKKGIRNIYSESIGSDIVTWYYLKKSGEGIKGQFVNHTCSCVINYIEKCHPTLIDKLPKVESAYMCTAIYAKEYLGDRSEFAFISPCIARKGELADGEREDIVGYNLTFKRLFESIDESEYEDLEVPEDSPEFFLPDCNRDTVPGIMSSCTGNLSDCIYSYIRSDIHTRYVEGVPKSFEYLRSCDEAAPKIGKRPITIDAVTCNGGCLFGTGTDRCRANDDELLFALKSVKTKQKKKGPGSVSASKKALKEALLTRFEGLDPESFERNFYCKTVVERHVPDVAINAVFYSMHKHTDDSRHIDCHSCGYHSCINMARAVALGYANKNSCVHYVQDENLRLFCTDVFTDIPNVNAFSDFCKKALRRKHGVGYTAIRFNIRNFSLINKNYGLQVGDDAIKEFAYQAHALAEEDEIVARISEDNFIGMIRTERLSFMIQALNNITLHLKPKRTVIEYPVSVYIGIYTLEGNDKVAGDIIRKLATTIAAIRRKHDVQIIYFDESIANNIHKEMSIERMLPSALADGELLVYYQPKVRISDNMMCGAEALIRWEKNGTLIPPIDFIPISEEIGFVRQIDFFVLESVCRKLREWIDRGLEPVRISVNFSKKHFINNNVAECITEVIDKYDVPHQYIEVEFTETAYLDGSDNLSSTLAKLKSYGISASIDDFGTGYSSLNLLQDLDFSALKLDKSLLGQKCYDTKTRTVISNVIRMAKELDMQIIAEGVETIEEYELLEQLSCDAIQGYLFDRPLPESEFEKHLLHKKYLIDTGK